MMCVAEMNACGFVNPCDHGDCVAMNATSYTCTCDIGYVGRLCEIGKFTGLRVHNVNNVVVTLILDTCI